MSGDGAARRTARTGGVRFSAVTLWALGYILVGIGLATAAVWPVYESPRAIAVGLIGGLLGVIVAVVARMLRGGVLLALLAAVGVYIVAAVPLAIPSAMSSVPAALGGVRDAVFGVVLGWKQMLTLNPPLGEYQAVLVPFLVVMLFGAFAATMLALEPGRRAVLAVAIIAAMSVFGIAFGVTGTSSPVTVGGITLPAPREWLLGVAVFASALVWVIGRSRLQRAAALRSVAVANISRRATPKWLTVRRHLLSGALVIVAIVAGIAIMPAAAGWSDRSVLRDEIEPMVVVQQQPSPLSAYRSWFTAEHFDEPVLRIQGDTGAVERIRFATLDSYDGEEFHIDPDDRFSRLPRNAAPASGRVSFEVIVGDIYRGIWVPSPAHLAEAPDFAGSRADELADGFHVDADGDTAITVAGTPDGGNGLVPGDRYRVLVDVPSSSGDVTSMQAGESTLDTDRYPALVEWAQMQEQPRTGAGYLELIDRLRSRGYLSHALLDDDAAAGWIASLKASEGYAFAPSYAGHSSARVEEIFTDMVEQERRAGSDAADELLVSAVGDDEQYAVAAALLAQHWGLQSRVVIGARLAAADEVPGITSCTEVCTGSSMTAWVEVRSADGEWGEVDVTPQYATLPTAITEGEQLPEHPTVPEQPRSEALDPPQAQSDSNNDAPQLENQQSEILAFLLPILRAVGLGLLALALLLLPFAVLLFAKLRRARSRRHAGDPEQRLAGAWEELMDLYADHGVQIDERGTRSQRAASSSRDQAAVLGDMVDRGVFAEHLPTAADAAAAWTIVDQERADLIGGESRWRRLVSRVRPTSFLARVAGSRGRGFASVGAALGTLGMTASLDDRQKENQ